MQQQNYRVPFLQNNDSITFSLQLWSAILSGLDLASCDICGLDIERQIFLDYSQNIEYTLF